jgi:hypothetical protein
MDGQTDISKLIVAFRNFANAPTNESGTSNNRGNRNHLKIIQKRPDQHTGKARNQKTTENSHIRHCMHPSESTNVKVQKM